MIFVGGMGRSGTSAMMECLRLSGYNIGRPEHLHGHKYQSEYRPFFDTIDWLCHSIVSNGGMRKIDHVLLNNIATYTLADGVEAIKVLKLGFFMCALLKHEIMKESKFIIMKRDFAEAEASAKRLIPNGDDSEESFKKYLHAWHAAAWGYPCIEINHSDFVYNTHDVQEKLSGFLGRGIDTSIVSPEETYAATGDIH